MSPQTWKCVGSTGFDSLLLLCPDRAFMYCYFYCYSRNADRTRGWERGFAVYKESPVSTGLFSCAKKQSFRWGFFQKACSFQRQRLWPPSADGGTLHTSGVFGGLGAFTRERPPRPLPIPLFPGGKRPPRWGGGPAGARGGPSYLFAACGRPAGSPSSFFLLTFSGIPAGWLPLE